MEPPIDSIVRVVREQLVALYGPRFRKLVLFGSQARDEAIAGSDVDLLLVLDAVSDFWAEYSVIEEIMSRLSLEYDVAISVFSISEQEYAQKQTPFLMNVRREGVLV